MNTPPPCFLHYNVRALCSCATLPGHLRVTPYNVDRYFATFKKLRPNWCVSNVSISLPPPISPPLHFIYPSHFYLGGYHPVTNAKPQPEIADFSYIFFFSYFVILLFPTGMLRFYRLFYCLFSSMYVYVVFFLLSYSPSLFVQMFMLRLFCNVPFVFY